MNLLELVAGTILLIVGLLWLAAWGLTQLLDHYDQNLWKDNENE
jgi:hypothetical protein